MDGWKSMLIFFDSFISEIFQSIKWTAAGWILWNMHGKFQNKSISYRWGCRSIIRLFYKFDWIVTQMTDIFIPLRIFPGHIQHVHWFIYLLFAPPSSDCLLLQGGWEGAGQQDVSPQPGHRVWPHSAQALWVRDHEGTAYHLRLRHLVTWRHGAGTHSRCVLISYRMAPCGFCVWDTEYIYTPLALCSLYKYHE